MKKVLIVLISICVLVLAVSCGTGWQQTTKNIKSNLGGGLDREIKVYNLITNDIVWENSGKSYIDDNSDVGNISIIYYVNGESKKADFIGSMYGVQSIEH